jgi:hypothetical protein
MTYDNIHHRGTCSKFFCVVAMTFFAAPAFGGGERPATAAPGAAATAPVGATASASAHPAAAGGETAQRMRQDMQSVLSHMAETGALGQHPEHVSLRVEEPARRVTSVGALVDSTSAQSARDGLHVLGATPGSTADRLGLHPGDVIVTVNGTSLRDLGADDRGRALAATTMRTVVEGLPDDATLNVDVVRGGNALTLNAPVQAVYVPAMRVELGDAVDSGGGGSAAAVVAPSPGGGEGCGRISALDLAPRGEHLYAVRILLLDGSTPGPTGSPSFRVGAGEHQLLVAENIPTQALGVGAIATLRRQTSKPLTVTVPPGKTVLLAAKLHLANGSDLSHGTYWDPVAWKEIAESCR